MPVLKAPLDPVTIASLKGTLDYYLWRGLPVIRKWPRKPSAPRTAAVVASYTEFGLVAKLLSSLPAPWRQETEDDVANTNWTWRDEWTAALYGNLFHPSKESPAAEEFPMPALLAGRYYTAPIINASYGTQSLATGTYRAIPFYCPAPTVFDRLSWEITATTGGNDRAAIYGPFSADIPNVPLLLDTGNVAIAATGVKESTISITLATGWYLLALQSSVTRTYRTLNVGSWQSVLGQGAAGNVRPAQAIERTVAYAAFPATFGTPGNYQNTNPSPLIWLRAA